MSQQPVKLDELPPLQRRELPQSPLNAAVQPIRPEEPEPAPVAEGKEGTAVAYVPHAVSREHLVSWSCKMPLRLREKLEQIAKDYDTNMTSIVVDLLEINLPKIPRKKR
jgi:hypothetical protein